MKFSFGNKLVILFGCGVFTMLTGGFLGWFGFPSIMNSKIQKFKKLNNNDSIQMFIKLPAPMEFKVYFFNVSNPKEIENGAMPELQELGPYVYDEIINKIIMDSNTTNRMRYMKNTTFKYNDKKSMNNKESDIVTIFNLPLMSIALFLEKHMPIGKMLFDQAIPAFFPQNDKLVITDTVANLLFNGHALRCTDTNLLFCEGMRSRPLRTIIYDEEMKQFNFAFFRHKNGTSGPFEVDKGLDDIRNVGQIVSYKGKSVINTWVPNSTCDQIKGTDSTIFGPFLEKGKPIHIFEPDICLSGTAEYSDETSYLGMPVSKYVGSRLNFAEEGTNCRCPRDNYSDPSSLPDCLTPGLIDLTPCQGAPIIASQPHFYQSESQLQFSEIIRPNAEKHETYTLLDRLTGVPVEGRKRLQLNIQLKPIDNIAVLMNVANLIFPVIWIDEGVQLDANILEPLIKVYKVLAVLSIAKWILLGIGALLIICGVIYYVYKKNADESCPNGTHIGSQDSVLFSKVTRTDGLTGNPISADKNSSSYITTRINNNFKGQDNCGFNSNSTLYPEEMDTGDLRKKNYEYPH